ncbi:MAG: Stp1/IreP family PP2C-type Ser/Thr phosphatase [Bacteroidia bacterium]|nr:Stp1/IreP family PP2C-type Ser/Thr phosphatase [Bacteroidia bacterium]MDW8347337.1 Stp1/IreP family PP2C-type Ser/Thr phosphatase [Bacteroidia bacterium]
MHNFVCMDIQDHHVSDVGKIRKVNEDVVKTLSTSEYFASVVCDGLGGHAGGSTAADMCANIILQNLKENPLHNIESAIIDSISKANEQIHTRASTDIALKGMGTTCVVALFYKGYIYFAHVGDSRLYQYHNKELTQLTKDHSYVQQLIDEGVIQPSDAEVHPQKHQLTAAVGTQTTLPIPIKVQKLPLHENAIFLLCTDGLHGIVSHKIIQGIFEECATQPIQTLAQKLVDTANEFGGVDNITVHVIRVQKISEVSQNSMDSTTQNTHSTENNTKQPLISPPIEVMQDTQAPSKEQKPRYTIHLSNNQKLGFIVIALLATVITLFVAFYKNKQKPIEENFLNQLTDTLSIKKDTSAQKNTVAMDTASKKTTRDIKEVHQNNSFSNSLIDYEYYVQKGEVLGKIADKFNVSVDELKTWNSNAKKKGHPKFPDLNAEAPLNIKIKAKHTVEQGETLSSIAEKYYGNAQQRRLIIKANQLKENTPLKKGKVLIIPKE